MIARRSPSPLPVSLFALALLAPGLSPAGVVAQEEFQNLQVLPADLSRPELTRIMRGFTAALGMRCSGCHVGEEGQPLSTYDMASDDKPMKQKARAMLRMVQVINGEYLAELPDRGTPEMRVSCATCHGGVARPEAIEALLVRVASEDGGTAAAARYRELRERYFGGRAYDFGEGSLQAALATLVEAQDGAATLALAEVAVEFFPESAGIAVVRGQAHELQGDPAAAVAAYRRALELNPEERTAQRRLEALGGVD